jgi:chromosome segregation ATPase
VNPAVAKGRIAETALSATSLPRRLASESVPNVHFPLPVVRATLENGADDGGQNNAQSPVIGSTNPAISIDAMRETERQQTLVEQMKQLLAQRAVFSSERDATAPVVPKELANLVGEQEAQRLVSAQANARALAKAEIDAQDAMLVSSVETIKRELAALHERVAQIEANSATKSDRLKLLQTASSGVIAKATLGEARAAVAEIEERRQDVLIAIAQTEQRLVQAEQERARLTSHTRAELVQALLALDGQINQLAISLDTSRAVLAAIKPKPVEEPAVSGPIRQIPAKGTDL